MSRWGKARPQPFTLPLDALVKEKENTNRPVAARSAGTVGKWGITSFTSIRTRPVYGFASFSPKHETFQYSNISPRASIESQGHLTPTSRSPDVAPIAKPKKFFKSRNSDPEPQTICAPSSSFHDHQHSLTFNSGAPSGAPSNKSDKKISIKINKKSLEKDKTRKPKAEKVKVEKIKVEKPKEEKVKVVKVKAVKPKTIKKKEKTDNRPVKAPEQPTRVTGRTRKTVNYSEDKSRSPSPTRLRPEPYGHENQSAPGVTENSSVEIPNESQQEVLVGAESPSKNADHPPIVLRISKGTSRLISTDSEGINNSPPYLSPPQQFQLASSSTSTVAAAAALVAVLSDDRIEDSSEQIIDQNQQDAVPLPNNHKGKKTTEKSKPKPEPIKIKIKTKLTNAFIASLEEEKNHEAVGKKPRVFRAAKKQLESAENNPEIAPDTEGWKSPQSRAEGYTVPAQGATEDLDSQSSLLGSEPALATIGTGVAGSQLNDASPYQDTRSDSSRVVPPSVTELQVAADLDNALYPSQEDISNTPESDKEPVIQQPTVRRRGRPKATAAVPKKTSKQDQNAMEPSNSPKRVSTRPKRGATNTEEETESEALLSEPEIVPKKRRAAVDNIEPTTSETTATAAKTRTAGRRGAKSQIPSAEPKAPVDTEPEAIPEVEEVDIKTKAGRPVRNKTNGAMLQEKDVEMVVPTVTRSYGRKRKAPPIDQSISTKTPLQEESIADESLLLLPHSNTSDNLKIDLPFVVPATSGDSKLSKTRGRRRNPGGSAVDEVISEEHSNQECNAMEEDGILKTGEDDGKPSVKLVISKKKGSIFKSRAIDVNSGENKSVKRHVYKHKWDDDLEDDKGRTAESGTAETEADPYSDEFNDKIDGANSGNTSGESVLSRLSRQNVPNEESLFDDPESNTTEKKFYTRVRNVKRAHQMQEIGEFQEMDDDVEYILESLKSLNPIATRSLAAIQLASKCMTPAFRMHVRAHGTATKFFSALHDATENQSLGLCTATIMFVLIQDNLNMDLDKHSLELMLNLLDTDISQKNSGEDSGLTDEQMIRNEQKVIEICRDIKSQGKAVHLNLDNVSTGTLVMETLLTLTSKRAGEWFKDELRSLGGLEHIINTICECCQQISDYVVEWTDVLLEKLRKIERCLRVLENVSERNEDNQKYILCYRDGHAVETLVKFYKFCESEITQYPTQENTPADNPGVVLREALLPTLKVLINLTHTFNHKPLGSVIFGENYLIFDTSLHLLFQASQYVPEKCIFELNLLVLLLLINLTMYTQKNRVTIMEASTNVDFGKTSDKVPTVKALIEYFYKYEELARFVEQNTDDILNNPEKSDKSKHKSQEEIEETVSTLLQKAGNHMEHTLLASYVCLLVGHLVMDSKPHEMSIRSYLRNGKFDEMVQILDKYYNFMNLTASSEAIQVAHMKETKKIIQYLKNSDVHSIDEEEEELTVNVAPPTTSRQTYSASSTSRGRNNLDDGYSTQANSAASNSVFNKVYYSR